MDLEEVKRISNTVYQWHLDFLRFMKGEVYGVAYYDKRSGETPIKIVHLPGLRGLRKIIFQRDKDSFYLFDNDTLFVAGKKTEGKIFPEPVIDFNIKDLEECKMIIVLTRDSRLISWNYAVDGIRQKNWNIFYSEISVMAEHVKDWFFLASSNIVSFIDRDGYNLLKFGSLTPSNLRNPVLSS